MATEPNRDDCRDNQDFYSRDLWGHLARAELRRLIHDKRHWIFAGTPDTYLLIERLHMLKHASCDDDCQGVLSIASLPWRPALIMLPKDRVSYADLQDVFGELPDPEAELAAKDFVCLSAYETTTMRQAIARYFRLDPISN